MLEKHIKRFWSKVDIRGLDECWPWLASRDDKNYGAFKYRGHMHKASRIALSLKDGPVPRHLHALHRCGNPPCCNPAHLYAGTQSQNMLDCVAHGRHNRKRKNGGEDGIRTHDSPHRAITV